ncbi:MAG: DUF5678 domain-containing protein [Microcystis sp. LE17-20A]|jgi:hypothetical protein|uniref:DUF5678 domain-containing protein n=1 Tax=Microcystis TaxID=1125 RepID=UPI0016808EA1|nr:MULTISPECIES: DUF5678 domain-containing protein [Microcystis]MBD2118127.1 hypothetical protein [Microcystis wesenbergii FACHB-1339]MCZ8040518.1 DUF5678 domain-containing protein [Microcystis sp. LE17-20A]MCZ8211076.1 DUF5678 domain-containing protein [Microcystis sp. LE19-8.1F]
MTNSISKEKAQEILRWLNKNRDNVLDLYKNQYIDYNEKGVIAHGENLQNVLEQANTTNQEFVIYLVPPCRYSMQILPVQV